MIITYKSSRTANKFHNCDEFVRALLGPIGSGKSVACVEELFMKAHEQEPDINNERKTRWIIVRNTYRELIDTTCKTFFDWIPKEAGNWHNTAMTFTYQNVLEDSTVVHAEFLFRALDRPQDVKKLLSLELTGGWINEAREIPKQIFEMLQGRVGRYPRTDEANQSKPTWYGVILDTNPPDSDHWFYKLFEEVMPGNHKIFKQPSGESEFAENIKNLPPNYYGNMQAGKDQEWINVYVHGIYGFVSDGKPVFPEYNDDTHHIDIDYKPDTRLPIFIGIDFGLTPAAVFGQITASGRMIIFDELCTFDMGALSFGKLLHQKLMTKYLNHAQKSGFVEIYGDPAGDQRAQTDEQTPFQVLANCGINASPAYTNDFTIRREAVADYMMRLDFTGVPAFAIANGASMIRKACAGGYKYKRVQVSGEERFQDKPDKGRYSHVADAMQYLFLGAVGGSRVIGGYDDREIVYDNRGIV